MQFRTLPRLLTTLAGSLALLAGLSAASGPRPGPAGPASDGRVIVLGFDGADGRTVAQLMEEHPGEYPTFRRLAAEGAFAPLQVEAPPESPVAWASLNTGQNPAKTGVPGFIRRNIDPKHGPLPGLGHIKNENTPLAEIEGAPQAAWSAGMAGGVVGGAAFLGVTVLLLLITRGKVLRAVPPALLIGVLAGGAAAYKSGESAGYLPDTFPRVSNPNQARNFWDYAAEAGRRWIVLDAAQAFDMPAPEGARVLAGLGVPDARNEIGSWFIYTTDPDEVKREPAGRSTSTAGTVFRVDEKGGRIETKLYGPKNFWRSQSLGKEVAELQAELRSPALSLNDSVALSEKLSPLKEELKQAKNERVALDMSIVREGSSARITIDGQEQVVAEGGWSDFFELNFVLNPLLEVHALTRVHVRHVSEPHFEMFVDVLHIDPRNPPFWQSISQPHEFAAELAHDCGPFETYGWSTATMPFKDKEISAEMLLQEVEYTLNWRENVTMKALERGDWDGFMSVFSTTDRVQHMMYQYYDVEHPLYDASRADDEVEFFGERITLGEAIPAIYRQMDRLIGRVLDEHVGASDTLLVCSDHGFQSFRRQVHINNWLADNGYLALKRGTKSSSGLSFVDWSQTRVYALGMGFIYVNMEGREPNGIVSAEDAPALLAKLKSELLVAEDPSSGERFCREFYVTKEIHSGPHLNLESDAIVGFAPTYRISWSSTSGGVSYLRGEDDKKVVNDEGGHILAPVCSDNMSPWSGGHVSVALQDVAGVFFSNRKLADPSQPVKLLQLAPTILELQGVERPSVLDLQPLEFVQ